MLVEHELDQGPVQAGEIAVHDIEAGAGNFTRGFKVHLPQGLSQGNVVPDLKIELGWLSPARNFLVVVLAGAFRHLVSGDIGHGQQQLFQLRLNLLCFAG